MTNAKTFDLITGEIILVNSAVSPHAPLEKLADDFGFHCEWKPQTAAAALGETLKNFSTAGRQGLIKQVGEKWVTAEVEIDAGSGSVFTKTRTYGIPDGLPVEFIDGAPDEEMDDEFINEWTCQMKLTPAGKVTNGVSNALVKHFGAIRLRERGGVFFVPASGIAAVEKFVGEYLKAAPNCQFHRIQCSADANTTAAIMETGADDLRKRYRGSLDALANLESPEAGSSNARIAAFAKKRKKLVADLDVIKKLAADISAAFGGANVLVDSITKEIDAEVAMSLLMLSCA